MAICIGELIAGNNIIVLVYYQWEHFCLLVRDILSDTEMKWERKRDDVELWLSCPPQCQCRKGRHETIIN